MRTFVGRGAQLICICEASYNHRDVVETPPNWFRAADGEWLTFSKADIISNDLVQVDPHTNHLNQEWRKFQQVGLGWG